ncbi:probable disease resistance protein At4g27220 [Macadamia integrifolia]|uniref:probable disease resistance protein At4g27220 n=1 Tax=Macadamia integrifolia TaxID=60698 RepID=UPI001C4FEC3A|nr:probable disease resistance protein At4g27220 [Macadamia integrifolia]
MEIVTGLVSELVNLLIPPFLRNLGYLVHYERNFNELRNQMKRLEELRTDNQRSVDVNQRRGQVIKEVVKSWLDRVDATQREVSDLYDAFEENKGCFKVGCRARYRLGKEAKRKTDEVNNLRTEGQFDAVSIPPPPPHDIELMPPLDFQVYLPTKSAMKQIMEALEVKKYSMVGVYGMGGVGKTTLMKEMAKELKNNGLFDRVVMVTVSQNRILTDIQNEIAEKLGFKFEDVSESVRASRLLERVKQEKRILIILDDLWKPLTLTEVGIPHGDRDGEGNDGRECNCSIIITTRSLEVCNQMQTQSNVEVKVLPEADAWQLFRRSAGDRVDSPELHVVATKVVTECGGLPVALVTIGRGLRDKDPIIWNDAVSQLKKSTISSTIPGMEERVFLSIKLSYDYLKSEETQFCFLLCCLFPEDSDISEDELFPYVWGEEVFKNIETLKDGRNRLHTVLDMLKRSCLLLNVDGVERCVRMHDIVRDVAIWIASQEEHGFVVKARRGLKQWPDMKNLRKCKRLSLMNNDIDEVPEQVGCSQLITLSLRDNISLREIADGCFEGMTTLKVLDLKITCICSIPSSFSWLTELRVLLLSSPTWEGEDKKELDLLLLGNMKNLEILDLSYSDIRTLPLEIRGLTNLKSLDLSYNPELIIPPTVLSRLSRLEELNLFGSFNEWEAEGSRDKNKACFSEVTSLAGLTTLFFQLSTIECLGSVMSPSWENLTRFFICLGHYEEDRWRIGESSGEAGDTLMVLSGITIPRLPRWVEKLLGRTEVFGLIGCHGHKNIYPGGLIGEGSGLNNLRLLAIQECRDLEHILRVEVEEVTFNRLEELQLIELPNLRKIYNGPFLKGSLENLRQLRIDDCSNLSPILPVTIAQGLLRLEEITISSNFVAEEIIAHDDDDDRGNKGKMMVLLPKLRKLHIQSCFRLKHICEMSMAQSLTQLEKIEIFDCPVLEEIFVESNTDGENESSKVVVLPQLRVLRLVNLPNFSAVCRGVSLYNFPVCEELYINQCPNLKRLPVSPESTPRLKKIHIRSCFRLKHICEMSMAQGLTQLEKIEIFDCPVLEEIFVESNTDGENESSKVVVLPQLRVLRLVDLPNFSAVCRGLSLCNFPVCEALCIYGCPNLKKLPVSRESTPRLREIEAEEAWFNDLEWNEPREKLHVQETVKVEFLSARPPWWW